MLFGGIVDTFLFAEEGVDAIDVKVKLQVKLNPHGLDVLGPHGKRHELGKLQKELISQSLVEQLNNYIHTVRRSFLISS